MKKIFASLILATLLCISCGTTQTESPATNNLTPSTMQISSPAFDNNGSIPVKYTCNGEDINPPLVIAEVPEEAQSLVLIVDDPDAPVGNWTHWLMWNIDPSTAEIAENSVSDGAVQGTNSWGRNDYGGPCPPSGTHRYFFKLYALDTKLDLASSADQSDLEKTIEGHSIASAELMGAYSQE